MKRWTKGRERGEGTERRGREGRKRGGGGREERGEGKGEGGIERMLVMVSNWGGGGGGARGSCMVFKLLSFGSHLCVSFAADCREHSVCAEKLVLPVGERGRPAGGRGGCVGPRMGTRAAKGHGRDEQILLQGFSGLHGFLYPLAYQRHGSPGYPVLHQPSPL